MHLGTCSYNSGACNGILYIEVKGQDFIYGVYVFLNGHRTF